MTTCLHIMKKIPLGNRDFLSIQFCYVSKKLIYLNKIIFRLVVVIGLINKPGTLAKTFKMKAV